MSGRYPDKPPHASDGKSFEQLGVWLIARFFDWHVHVYDDARSQIEIGESPEGFEFKHLQRSFSRLHIEMNERRDRSRPWVKSGICRADNGVRYVCGNDQEVFIFRKADLRDWHRCQKPKEIWYGQDRETGQWRIGDIGDPLIAESATIHSYILGKTDANLLCLCRFVCDYGEWSIHDGLLLLDLTLEQVRDELRRGLPDQHNRRRKLWLTLDWLVAKPLTKELAR